MNALLRLANGNQVGGSSKPTGEILTLYHPQTRKPRYYLDFDTATITEAETRREVGVPNEPKLDWCNKYRLRYSHDVRSNEKRFEIASHDGKVVGYTSEPFAFFDSDSMNTSRMFSLPMKLTSDNIDKLAHYVRSFPNQECV